MKKLIFLFLLIGVASATCIAQQHNNEFEIIGKLTGFTDSTLLYLDKSDSVYIIGNQFHFTGSINEPTKQVLIRTKDYSDYKFFWLENKAIMFDVSERINFWKKIIVNGKETD
jgi:hypothetical protein